MWATVGTLVKEYPEHPQQKSGHYIHRCHKIVGSSVEDGPFCSVKLQPVIKYTQVQDSVSMKNGLSAQRKNTGLI